MFASFPAWRASAESKVFWRRAGAASFFSKKDCLLAVLLVCPPALAKPPILQALQANDWTQAAALAAAEPDPLAGKLVEFIRLLNPGQASAAELAGFIKANPGWPDQATLERRYGEALVLETDAATAAALCRQRLPQAAPALLRCADAFAAGPAAVAAARAAWAAGVEEAGFLARWSPALRQDDEVARFEQLLGSDAAAAERQLPRLDQPARAVGAARLALRNRAADAMARVAAVPERSRQDPALLLAQARYLRRGSAYPAALAVWQSGLLAAEAAVAPARRPAFWAERDALARALAGSDPAAAYGLADDGLLAPDQGVEADFLAGWIALQRLHDPIRARLKFTALAAVSHSAISQSRAFYWLGRAAADAASAKAAWFQAAAWPLTYYGQAAERALGLSEAALRKAVAAEADPAPDAAAQAAFAGSEPARAARILAGWGDARRGADFLALAIQPPASLAARAVVARLALQLGLPDVAVQAARLAGRDGTVLPQAGWPMPYTPPAGDVPAALALAVMRQESSFDPAIVSAAGAHGLMQMMPGTVQMLARTRHLVVAPLADPDVNMQLGTAYLADLLARFGGTQAYAVAAYNAGPNRVTDWIAANGDASSGSTDAMIDWIEMIPFNETRNYVQRVLENEVDYASRAAPG